MRKNSNRKPAVFFLILISGFSVFFISLDNNDAFRFQLSPLDFQGNVELPNVLCNVSQENRQFDINGNQLAYSDDSLTQRPSTTFSVLNGNTESEIYKFNVKSFVQCDIDYSVPMTVSHADLKTVVYGTDADGSVVSPDGLGVWNQKTDEKKIPIKSGSKVEISAVSPLIEDIMKYQPEGEYDSNFEFTVYGTISMYYDQVPEVVYKIEIPKDSLSTTYSVKVTKDTPAQPGSPGSSPEPQDDGNSDGVNVLTKQFDLFGEWFTLLSVGDYAGLMNIKFGLGYGVVAIILTVSLIAHPRPRQTIVGVPY